MTDERLDHQPWPLRALILLGLGAVLGLVFHLLVNRADHLGRSIGNWTDDPARLSLATFVAAGGLLFAFTLERLRWTWTAGFAAAGGAILGLIFYWNGSPESHGGVDSAWRFISGLLAVAIAAPLFQTMRDEGARRLPYATVHAHAWTNVVLWFAAWAFVLVSWLLVLLLSQLFSLIGIDLLENLLEKEWFALMLTCGTLGAAAGLLRDRDRILGLLQRVVTAILSFLAPVLALGLVLFVLALPFTGLEPLWEQTKATTPILLGCAIGAIILANAVIGNSPEEEAKAPPLRWSAMALGAVMLPLIVVAAISTGLRIDQHGLTPARLWACVFILIAGVWALAYLVALVLGRSGWAGRARSWNIRIALGVCALALLLATPIVSFGALSTRDQVARLESGRIPPADFDWAALRFDFGPSGRQALERLRNSSSNAEVKRLATRALGVSNRWDLQDFARERRLRAERRAQAEGESVRVFPAGVQAPPELRRLLAVEHGCVGQEECVLLMEPGGRAAVLMSNRDLCSSWNIETPSTVERCNPVTDVFRHDGRSWTHLDQETMGDDAVARHRRILQGLEAGQIEIHPVPRRQLFVAGEPVGDPFE